MILPEPESYLTNAFAENSKMTLPEPERYLTKTFAQIEKLLGQISGIFQDNLLLADDVHATLFRTEDTSAGEVVNGVVALRLGLRDGLDALEQSLDLFQRIFRQRERGEGHALKTAHVHHQTNAHFGWFGQHEEDAVGCASAALRLHFGIAQGLGGEVFRVRQRGAGASCTVSCAVAVAQRGFFFLDGEEVLERRVLVEALAQVSQVIAELHRLVVQLAVGCEPRTAVGTGGGKNRYSRRCSHGPAWLLPLVRPPSGYTSAKGREVVDRNSPCTWCGLRFAPPHKLAGRGPPTNTSWINGTCMFKLRLELRFVPVSKVLEKLVASSCSFQLPQPLSATFWQILDLGQENK